MSYKHWVHLCGLFVCCGAWGADAPSKLKLVGPVPIPPSDTVLGIQFVGGSSVWALGAETLWRTTDGGDAWSAVAIPLPHHPYKYGLPPRPTQLLAGNFDSTDAGWIETLDASVSGAYIGAL